MSEMETSSPEQQAEEALAQMRVKAFVGGVKAASLAMRAVLARKADVGIISEVTAKSIFEAVGVELSNAFEEDKNTDADEVHDPRG